MSRFSVPIARYGLQLPDGYDDLSVELFMIKNGGRFLIQGKEYGLGMFEHMMRARALAWPNRYRHEWTELMYREFIANDISICVGAASTGKTATASEYGLLKYWASPDNTLVIVSTIDIDKLDTGIFGEIKMLFRDATERWPQLAGNLIDHRHCIATDCLADGEIRDLRRGILGRPVYQGSQWIGLGKLMGTKQENIIYLADEVQWMAASFVESWANLFSNGKVQIIASGNPKHDPDDQLGIAAEPEDGWASIGEPQVTTVWDTKFMGGRCINLVGTDSPNFRAVAKGLAEPYPKLIGPRFAARIAHDWGLDSAKYFEQVRGIMKIGMVTDRVITRQICKDHHAHDKAVWKSVPSKKVHGLDPSYGGDDECVSIILEFGEDISGKKIVRVVLVKVHRFNIASEKSVEDQIADQVFDLLKENSIAPTDSFYDPYGKGTLGYAFARKFGSVCPIPVDSGGKPTERPVRQDLFVTEKNGNRRLKKCSEHYVKFVTEAWFSVRYTIEADQMREFPVEVMREMCQRTYKPAFGDRIEIESKDDLKERTGKSPNKGDAMAVSLEGARQRGFSIGKLGQNINGGDRDGRQWLRDMVRQHQELVSSKQLMYA